MSSTKTPSPWVAQSEAYEIEISTWPPAYAPRSTRHCCQPPAEPDDACHAPLEPVAPDENQRVGAEITQVHAKRRHRIRPVEYAVKTPA